MSKVCVPGGQVPLRTLLLTSRYLPEQRKRGFRSVAYVAVKQFKTPTHSKRPTTNRRRLHAFRRPKALRSAQVLSATSQDGCRAALVPATKPLWPNCPTP